MALKKEKTIKGIKANYWKIIDCNVVNNQVLIAPFANQECAQNRQNMLEGRTKLDVTFDLKELEKLGMNAIKFAYQKAKESKMSKWEGLGLEEDFIPVETNWFKDSEDC